MKRALIILGSITVSCLFSYLIHVFYAVSFDISKWTPLTRANCAIMIFFLSIGAGIISAVLTDEFV